VRSESDKARIEVAIFSEFATCAGELNIDLDSVDKREPPDPDILARDIRQGWMAFELVELCDSDIAACNTELIKTGAT